MFNNNIFAERLYSLRTQANISQKVLADNIGVSYHAISKIENKQRAASIEVIFAISEYFHVSLDYLTGKSDSSNITTDSNDDKNLTIKEKELIQYFRLLDKYEKNLIIGKMSEIIYNKNVDDSQIELPEELVDIGLKDKLNN